MPTKQWIKLESRNEIISKVAEMVKTAQHSVYIIGHSARWLENKSFQEAINTVRNNIDVKFWITCPEDITNRIIGSLQTLKKLGVVDKVFKKSYGRIRICLVDGKKILLAHTLEYQDRRGNTSFGLYFEDNDFGHWLSGRFIELTQDAYEIDEKKFNIMIKSIWFSIKTHWIEWIIVAAIGALLTIGFSKIFKL